MNSRTGLLSVLFTLLALLALAAPAGAIPIPGENGRIVFASGRPGPDGNDTAARLFLQPVTFSDSGGPVSSAIVPSGGQYRHPTWSPDRTKVAFANGTANNDPATQNFDIFVLDIPSGSLVQITPSDGLSADRPSWSPDGTRLAFEHQPLDNNADRVIQVQSTSDLTPPVTTVPLTLTAAMGGSEGKPDWNENSSQVYYSHVDGADRDIQREPANNSGSPVTVLGAGADGVDQSQPALSPNGQQMCYTEGDTAIRKVSLPTPGAPVTINNDAGAQYNCTWSPDGDKIAFVSGAFTTGALMMEESDGSQVLPDLLTDDAGNFDGNPSWAPDGRPECPDQTVDATTNVPVTFDVECTDTGPSYERSNVRDARTGPLPPNGTLEQEFADDPYTFTSAPLFAGTVTFTVRSFDEFGFGSDTGTVTINVTRPKTPGGGEVFDGTAGNDTINGTAGPDVINCGAGNDVVNGGGGDDVINCGDGDDQVSGNTGNDQVNGEGGNDQVNGNEGDDQATGGDGNDEMNGGENNDRVDGGAGFDLLSGNEGNDRVTGGSGNDRANGNSGNDRVGGNTGNDRLGGQSGRDRVNGDSGRDRVSGGSSNDRAVGGSGNDRVAGDSGNDRVGGGSGNDRVSGGSGNDRVNGDSGRDRVSGNSGRDRLGGGSGRDRLNGGRGRDRCNGGRSTDRAASCERASRIP